MINYYDVLRNHKCEVEGRVCEISFANSGQTLVYSPGGWGGLQFRNFEKIVTVNKEL